MRNLFNLLCCVVMLSASYSDAESHAEPRRNRAITQEPTRPATFRIGEQNNTPDIRRLSQINRVSIALLEERMQPGRLRTAPLSDGIHFERSDNGFLGSRERLLDVLASDNNLVVDQWRLTHQALAKPMLDLIRQWRKENTNRAYQPIEVLYPENQPTRFRVHLQCTRGFQASPFGETAAELENSGSCMVHITNLRNGQSLETADLVPHFIHRYGFYEGLGTPYRLAPKQILTVFDFLRPLN